MTKIFEDQAAKIAKAADHLEKAKQAYVLASAEFDALTGAMADLTGYPPDDSIKGLIRHWGPKLAIYLGLPGAAVLVTGLSANSGAFSGIINLVKGLFGFGG